MGQLTPSLRKRPAGKLATTAVTNEQTDAINLLGASLIGQPGKGGILSSVLVRVDSAATGKGRYIGTIKLGPLIVNDVDDFDLDDLDDGPGCLLLNQGELTSTDPKWIPTTGDTPTFVLAWIVGITKGTTEAAVVMTNYNKAIRRLRVNVVGTSAQVQYSYSNSGDDWITLFTGVACS